MKNVVMSLALSLALIPLPQVNGEFIQTDGEAESQPVRVVDEFSGRPSLEWTIRNPDPEHDGHLQKAGTLTIVTQRGGIYRTTNNCKNLPNALTALHRTAVRHT